MDGFSIGRRTVNNIRYADEKLQVLLDVANRASEEKGLELNREKAECNVVSKRSETPVCPYK